MKKVILVLTVVSVMAVGCDKTKKDVTPLPITTGAAVTTGVAVTTEVAAK